MWWTAQVVDSLALEQTSDGGSKREFGGSTHGIILMLIHYPWCRFEPPQLAKGRGQTDRAFCESSITPTKHTRGETSLKCAGGSGVVIPRRLHSCGFCFLLCCCFFHCELVVCYFSSVWFSVSNLGSGRSVVLRMELSGMCLEIPFLTVYWHLTLTHRACCLDLCQTE